MADYLLGHEAIITLASGPAAASVFSWGMSDTKPLVDVTPSGATRRTYKQGLMTGSVWFNVMSDADLATPPIPPTGNIAFVGKLKSGGGQWAGNVILESATLQGATTAANGRQFFHYRGNFNGTVTVT